MSPTPRTTPTTSAGDDAARALDIVRPYGHYFLPLNRPAIAPVGESLPNSEIFRRLAAALGYDDACFQEDDATILRNLRTRRPIRASPGVTWEALLRDGYARLNLPQPYVSLRHGRLPHAQRQVRVLQRAYGRGRPRPAARAHAACVDGNAHAGAQRGAAASRRRWSASRRQPGTRCSSTAVFRTCPASPGARAPASTSTRTMPRCAMWKTALRSLWPTTKCGPPTAKVTADVVPGTVRAPGVWWSKLSPDGRNVNRITRQDEADMGAGAIFYDTLVTVTPVIHATTPYLEERPV
ncbi:MAG: hypothetical protein R3A10_07865 [Caldilineaceae bacterium]